MARPTARNTLSVNDVLSSVFSECDESDISDIFEGIIHYNNNKHKVIRFYLYNKDEPSSCDESVDNSTGHSDLNGKLLHKIVCKQVNTIT